MMDLAYGQGPTLEKFAALELIARVPYQAWENVAYVALTHTGRRLGFVRRIFEFLQEARAAQDNEQWHLVIVEELIARGGEGGEGGRSERSWLHATAIPQVLAFFYYHVSWLLYVILPRLSYALNAEFEDHAEREYLSYVMAHPELEREAWVSAFAADYGGHRTVADVLRQIARDERAHRDESLARMAEPRFTEGVSSPFAT